MAVKSEWTNFKEIARAKLAIVEMQSRKSDERKQKPSAKVHFEQTQEREVIVSRSRQKTPS